MPVFSYQGIDVRSRSTRGAIEAPSRRGARRLLLARGIRVAALSEGTRSAGATKLGLIASLANRLRAAAQRESVVEAFENVITMLQSGVTLEAAWAGAGASGKGRARAVVLIQRLHDSVSQGGSLAEAMRQHPFHFDKVDVALIRAGEDAGELATAMERLVARRRLSGKLGATLVSAMAYPAFLALFGCGVILFLAGYVIPDINAMLVAGGGSVPLLTRLLQATAWVLSVGLIPFAVLATLTIAVVVRRIPRLKSSLFRALLRLPVVGSACMNWQLSQFCLVLRTLLASGIQLPAALALAGEASGEGPVALAAQRLRQRVIDGHDLRAAPSELDSGIPPWLWQALSVGQRTGEMVEVLERVGQRFEAAALRSAARVGAVLEPLMILIVGAFVGLVAYAALMPIVKLNGLW